LTRRPSNGQGIITDEALAVLSEKLTAPLEFEQYLTIVEA